MLAPNARPPLAADALLSMLRSGLADMADHRPGPPDMSRTAALLAACALFARKSPALLACDKDRTAGNVQRVYGIERVPCDPALRARLAPGAPESLRPFCTGVFRALQRGTTLEERGFVAGPYLWALDGTGYCSSTPIHWEAC